MKYAFDVPIRVVVEAPSVDEAAGELIGLEDLGSPQSVGPLEIVSIDENGIGWVRACRVCGCTDDRACDNGCSWLSIAEGVMEGLCSTPDDAHAAALDELEKAFAEARS